MRLWSIHPQYLDSIGLVALWREGLLAQKVLRNETHGYKHHPQLVRFSNIENSIGNYLLEVYYESQKRGYHFDSSKILTCADVVSIPIYCCPVKISNVVRNRMITFNLQHFYVIGGLEIFT